MPAVTRIGEVTMEPIEEIVLPTSVRWMLPDMAREDVERCREWMQPHYMDAEGRLTQSIHTLLVRTPGLTALVDTGVGNGKDRTGGIPAFHMLETPWLARLAEAGVQPEDVDLVLCTHLHGDHCGWNTRREGDRWVPTFPKARYLLVDREWAHWSSVAAQEPATARLIEDSVQPVFDAGLVDLVPADHQLNDMIRFVPSHGHSPGHVTIEVESDGQRAALIGDVMHSPLQCAFPALRPALDRDETAGRAGRLALLERYAGTGTLIFGAHFPTPPGRIERDGDAFRFVAAEA
ncbi:MAG: MBL fold metallo-hydrolase [Chloroflexi bacterium]|nr:MBL fold metallo-hydrolase [Chloroflexota bacterium]MDA1239585.1 MBL fold metallo-hydrolase [Chloroflexota bacterium]